MGHCVGFRMRVFVQRTHIHERLSHLHMMSLIICVLVYLFPPFDVCLTVERERHGVFLIGEPHLVRRCARIKQKDPNSQHRKSGGISRNSKPALRPYQLIEHQGRSMRSFEAERTPVNPCLERSWTYPNFVDLMDLEAENATARSTCFPS